MRLLHKILNFTSQRLHGEILTINARKTKGFKKERRITGIRYPKKHRPEVTYISKYIPKAKNTVIPSLL